MAEGRPVRRSSRLLILDPEGRMLLFRYHDEHKDPFWSTVGGELKAGEDYMGAAERELQEETGFTADIGPVVHERDAVYAVARSQPARWLERYFLVRCSSADEPDRTGWTEEEQSTIQTWRWWRLSEMLKSSSTFLPECLPELLQSVLHGSGVEPERE